jgi:hypothetical protein
MEEWFKCALKAVKYNIESVEQLGVENIPRKGKRRMFKLKFQRNLYY